MGLFVRISLDGCLSIPFFLHVMLLEQMILKTTLPFRSNVTYHVETSQLICIENQLIGFYMMRNVVNHMMGNHFMPVASFYTSWKYQKTKGFLMFSGRIERDQWHKNVLIDIFSTWHILSLFTLIRFLFSICISRIKTWQSFRNLFLTRSIFLF